MTVMLTLNVLYVMRHTLPQIRPLFDQYWHSGGLDHFSIDLSPIVRHDQLNILLQYHLETERIAHQEAKRSLTELTIEMAELRSSLDKSKALVDRLKSLAEEGKSLVAASHHHHYHHNHLYHHQSQQQSIQQAHPQLKSLLSNNSNSNSHNSNTITISMNNGSPSSSFVTPASSCIQKTNDNNLQQPHSLIGVRTASASAILPDGCDDSFGSGYGGSLISLTQNNTKFSTPTSIIIPTIITSNDGVGGEGSPSSQPLILSVSSKKTRFDFRKSFLIFSFVSQDDEVVHERINSHQVHLHQQQHNNINHNCEILSINQFNLNYLVV